MAHISSVFAQTEASSDGTVDPLFYVVLVVLLSLVVVVMRWFFSRRAKAKVAGAADGTSNGLIIRIAPAPPFPDDVTRLRTFLGLSTPAPSITRYTVPVVTTDAQSLTIRDKKIGEIVSIPLTDIVSIEARDAQIRPKGTFLARTYPSLWVTVRRDANELALALTPVVGAYDKVRQADVENMAAELGSRLVTAHP